MTPRMAAAQHITVDGHFSPAQTLIGPNYSIGANLGKQVGSNLFHSFGQFGLSTGESAAFSGPATISNVISRVTGGIRSDINGKIQSNITGANLYLINPSGIVFGPNATVNVSGSFHASTADYLKMSDGAKFQATNPGGSTLSAAPPAAFGFLTARPSAITVNGSTLGPAPVIATGPATTPSVPGTGPSVLPLTVIAAGRDHGQRQHAWAGAGDARRRGRTGRDHRRRPKRAAVDRDRSRPRRQKTKGRRRGGAQGAAIGVGRLKLRPIRQFQVI